MSSPFDAVENASTLGGVVVGAVVATLGSFAASWYERGLLRREREADAALVFGELLRTLSIQITVLRAAHARGDPFGPITIRMARAVRREVDIYDRNRERLFTVRDAALRPQASAVMARLTFALDRILDSTEALATQPSEDECAELATSRDQAFEFLVECAGQLPPLVARFAALANSRLADVDLETIGLGAVRQDQG
ncbi:MAG TPA: hypothetical protein VGG29_18460 [Caulobacteraceae bacterium]|jgi:hypothetical protein